MIRNFFATGGAENFAREFAKFLKKRGIKIKVLTTREKFFKKRRESFDGIEIIDFFVPKIRFLGTIFYYLKLSFYLIRDYKNFDVILSFFLKHSSFISIIVGKILGKKVFCRVECSGKFGDIKAIKKIPFSFIFFNVFKRADKIIVLSKEMEKELLSNGFKFEKLVLIPNGIDVNKFKPLENKKELKNKSGYTGKKIILFSGRLTEQKGVEYLIRSFEKLNLDEKFLIIVGDGDLKDKLEKLVSELKIDKYVLFAGKREDVVPYLQMADIFVLPSLSEGLPLSLLEAMACGLPVVATKVGGNIDLVEDKVNGYLVEPGNVDEIKNAIENLLRDEEKLKEIGKINREKIVRSYSFEAIGEKYLSLFKT